MRWVGINVGSNAVHSWILVDVLADEFQVGA